MQDIPPEVSVALAVVQTLTAAGRCREDAELYQAAARLVRAYLLAATPPAEAGPHPRGRSG